MNHSFTPTKSSFNESSSSSDNSPAYFTGCVECIKIVSKIPLLSLKCDNLSKLQSTDLTVKGKVDIAEKKSFCNSNYDLGKNNFQALSPTFDSSPVLPKVKPNKCMTNECTTNKIITSVRRILLPSPSSSLISESKENENNSLENSKPSSTSMPSKKPDINNVIEEETSVIDLIENSTGYKRKIEGFDTDSLPRKRFRSPQTSQLSEKDNYKLSQRIWNLFFNYKQTEDVYKKKMALRDQLHKILLGEFPSCGLYVVGSSMTGLGANCSDMDMCIMLTHSEIDQEREAANILETAHNLFIQYDFLVDVEVIYAKVPILRFRDVVSGIEVDLNVNNAVGIRNTQLLSSYARIDERFPPLVVLVKLWARHHNINDAKNNTLSSYSLVLMVIHYLQNGCGPPVLPCLQSLQPDKFHPHSDVRLLKLHEDLPEFESRNNEDLGSLFLGFLEYFSNFPFQDSVISVRLGCVTSKESAMLSSSPKNKRGHWKFVCIEEPFDLTNTARAVFKPDAFDYLKRVFSTCWTRLRRTGNLHTVLKE